jgi:signal transduction histidine kinase
MQGIQHSITVPIAEAGEVVASVTVSRRTDRPFTASEARTLEVVSAAAGIALENARLFQDARQASLAKTEFLNMAGHELRTPLAVIRGYLSLIATGAYGTPPEGWVSVLSLLEDKSAELSTMVESILVAARLQTGRVQVSRDEVDLDAVVQQAVSRASAAAALTGGAVVGRYTSTPVRALGDARQIGVIVDNLLANAVKYSPPPAAVTATLESRGGFAEVRIADRGRGIPRDHQARIFEEFVRVDDKETGLTSGTGLGLYIARQLAERYGGSLELEWSEPGRGSSFLLRLPAIAS